MPTPRFGLELFGINTGPENLDLYNAQLELIDALANITFKSVTTLAQPTTPDASSVYYVPISATGGWSAEVGRVAVFQQTLGWHYFDVYEGIHGWVIDQQQVLTWNGTAWEGTNFAKRHTTYIDDPVAGAQLFLMVKALDTLQISRARYDFQRLSSDVNPVDVTVDLGYMSAGIGGSFTSIVPTWTADPDGGYETTSVTDIPILKFAVFQVTAITGTPRSLSVSFDYVENV